MNKLFIKILFLTYLLVQVAAVYSQEQIIIPSINGEFKFDGNVDDDCWRNVNSLSMVMHTSTFGNEPTEKMVSAQPIPVELMLGNKYGTVNLVFSKNFSQTSRFGFFHMNTVQFDYKDEYKNSFILQDLVYVETFKNIRVAAGVAYSKGGFAPTAGLQYLFVGKKFMFLFAPRVNIESDPSYDIMTSIQYKPEINDRLNLYTRIQMLNLFNAEGNIKSYQWMRLGLEAKGLQFGLAFNLDEFGPDPSVDTSFGVFIRKEIF